MATMTTDAALDTAVLAGAVGDDVTWVALFDALTGGNMRQRLEISNNPAVLTTGATLRIAAGWVIFTQLPGTNETEANCIAKLEGVIDGGLWVGWFGGNPGANGTSNVIAIARTPIAASAVTIA